MAPQLPEGTATGPFTDEEGSRPLTTLWRRNAAQTRVRARRDIVRGLARTSARLSFADRGEHELKGLQRKHAVFEVARE